MAGDPARDADADGRDLLVADPHPGEPGHPPGADAELSDGTDQHGLEVANVAMHVAAIRLEIEDGVSDQLTWPVIRDVAAAAGLHDLDAAGLQHLLAGHDV